MHDSPVVPYLFVFDGIFGFCICDLSTFFNIYSTIVIITKYFVQLACLVFQTGDLGLSARGPKVSKL